MSATQTEGIIRALLRLGGAMIGLIILAGLVLFALPDLNPGKVQPLAFVFWSLTAAFAAFLSGGALGLLFGLPTTQKRPDQESKNDPLDSTGYVDNTSLEQVSDFLGSGSVICDRWRFVP